VRQARRPEHERQPERHGVERIRDEPARCEHGDAISIRRGPEQRERTELKLRQRHHRQQERAAQQQHRLDNLHPRRRHHAAEEHVREHHEADDRHRVLVLKAEQQSN
jgi:hypothetical protein